MRVVFLLPFFFTCILYGTTSGSTHDAWSDWILETNKADEPEELAENESQETSADISESTEEK